MKYIGYIIVFFSILLCSVVAEGCPAEAGEMEQSSVHIPCRKQSYYTVAVEFPQLYGVEQNAERFFSSLRTGWWQIQNSLIERMIIGLKRLVGLASLREGNLTQAKYALFNHRFMYSKKPCSLYYVYAMRRILI